MLKNIHQKNFRIKLNEKLFSFLNFMEYSFCARCWYESKGKYDKGCWHSKGSLLHLMQNSKKMSASEFDIWQTKELGSNLIELFIESLSGDIYNNVYTIGQIYDSHHYATADMSIEKKIFAALFEKKNTNCNKELSVNSVLSSLTLSIQKIVEKRNNLWISHVCEHGFLGLGKHEHSKNFPEFFCKQPDPKFWSKSLGGPTMSKSHNTDICFACHIDRLRNNACHFHVFDHLKRHDNFPTTMGIIPMKDFLVYGKNKIVCAPSSTTGRDHPYCELHTPVPLDKWIFLYHDENDLICTPLKNNVFISSANLKKLLSVVDIISIKTETFKVLAE